MKLPDVNLWLALAISGHSHHLVSARWLEEQGEASSLYLCRTTQQALVRLLTTAAVLAPYGIPALTNREAWTVLESFLADDRIAWIDEPPGIVDLWKTLALRDTASPKLWMDAWLAALAMGANLQLVTFDRGFTQFDGLNLLLLDPSP